jgi:hypothetical protein
MARVAFDQNYQKKKTQNQTKVRGQIKIFPSSAPCISEGVL